MCSSRDAVAAQLSAGLGVEAREVRVEPLQVGVAVEHELVLDQVVLQVGGEEPDRRREPGEHRNQHLRDAERAGHLGRVERPGASEGDERELAGVVPLLDRSRADRVRHVVVDERDHAGGGLGDAEIELVAEPLDCRGGETRIDLHLAAEEVLGPKAAEDDVRVRHGRLLAPAPVAGGARLGAGATRPDAERAARVDVGDAAAAGADGVHVDHRHEDRVARDERLPGGRLDDAARRDDADVGARPADVERDQVLVAAAATDVGAGEHAGGRSAQQQRGGQLRRHLAGHDAAVRAHQAQLGGHAPVGHPPP